MRKRVPVENFSATTLLIFWAESFCCEGALCIGRVVSSIPGLYPLDASIETPHSLTQCRQSDMSPNFAKCPVGDKITPVGSNGFQNVLTPGTSASPEDVLRLWILWPWPEVQRNSRGWIPAIYLRHPSCMLVGECLRANEQSLKFPEK